MVVEPTHLKNMSQFGSFPQGSGWKWKNIWVATTQIPYLFPKHLLKMMVFHVPFGGICDRSREGYTKGIHLQQRQQNTSCLTQTQTRNRQNNTILPSFTLQSSSESSRKQFKETDFWMTDLRKIMSWKERFQKSEYQWLPSGKRT